MNILHSPNNNIVQISGGRITGTLPNYDPTRPMVAFDVRTQTVPFKTDVENSVGDRSASLISFADWKEAFPVSNEPLDRTRRLNIATLEGATISFKGAGGLFPITAGAVALKDKFRCLPPTTDCQRFCHDRFIKLSSSYDINLVDLREPDYERALSWNGAKNEFNAQNHLAESGLAMPAIFAAPYITHDGKPFLNNSDQQLGYVVEVLLPGWKNLAETKVLYRGVSNNPRFFHDVTRNFNSMNELTAMVRMRALIEKGLTGHVPHFGNFLTNVSKLDSSNHEPHEKFVISDTDEVTRTPPDASPDEKMAFLTSEISHHIFRAIFQYVRPLASRELFVFLNQGGVARNFFKSVLNGYFRKYASIEEIEEASATLSKDLLKILCDKAGKLIQLTEKRGKQGTIVQNESNRVEKYGEFYLKLLPLYATCLSETFCLIRNSKLLREMNFFPTIDFDKRELRTKFLRQIAEIK